MITRGFRMYAQIMQKSFAYLFRIAFDRRSLEFFIFAFDSKYNVSATA